MEKEKRKESKWNQVSEAVFQSYEYHQFMGSKYNHKCYLITNQDKPSSKIIMPLMVKRYSKIVDFFVKSAIIFEGPDISKSENNSKYFQLIETFCKEKKISIINWDSNIKINKKEFFPRDWNTKKCTTILIDLKPDIKEIYNRFHKKIRYSIRKADPNIKITKVRSKKQMELYYELNKELSLRSQKVAYNNKKYYYELFDKLIKNNKAEVFIATHENDVLNAAIILKDKTKIHYYKGASSFKKRNLHSGELLHWEIIKWAKKENIKEYDLRGVKKEAKKGSPKHKIYLFKKRWGGIEKEYYKGFKIYNPLRYHIGGKIILFASKLHKIKAKLQK